MFLVGKNLLCGYGDGGVRLWDLKESKPIHHWDGEYPLYGYLIRKDSAAMCIPCESL